ncbi:hypothetical protein GGF32_008003 [Allomyces javanicus]|nr:hypothetical protein GGF32_008003 [Allomyces javanicus]
MTRSQHQQRASAAPATDLMHAAAPVAATPVSRTTIKDTPHAVHEPDVPLLADATDVTITSLVPRFGDAETREPYEAAAGAYLDLDAPRAADLPKLTAADDASLRTVNGDDEEGYPAPTDVPDPELEPVAAPVTTAATGKNSPEVMARNREHAANSRKRKSNEFDQLEAKVADDTNKVEERKRKRQRLLEELNDELGATLAVCQLLLGLM